MSSSPRATTPPKRNKSHRRNSLSTSGDDQTIRLFHVKRVWHRAAEFAGLDLDEGQSELLERFGIWLGTEAQRAGGIGPAESERIDRRHLADALLFASEIPPGSGRVWDLGSGVGLPGIPLAIALPDREFDLIDRSGRRVDLMRRAIRMLDLGNCQATQADIEDLSGPAEVIVSRASLPPDRMLDVADGLLEPGGVAVLAGSWHQRPEHAGWTTVEIPHYVLDQPVWLLIMRRE